MKTIIAVPDFTREAHLKKILHPLVKRLLKQGMAYGDMEIIIATGLHRPPTKKEIKINIGNVSKKIKTTVHTYKKDSVAYFGKTKNNVPVYLNKKLKDADYIVTVGVVEPHLYAGYSGGTKAVAIGLAGEKTINATHHPRFLDNPGTKICSLKKNPFSSFIKEAARFVPVKYSVNIINDKKGKLSKVFEGNPADSYKNAVEYCKKIFEKKTKETFDVVICDIPKKKGINIYQASRAFNYIADARNNVLKPGSLILVKADLEEGFGKGLGEKRFMNRVLSMKDPKKTLADIKKRGCLAGEHRAYMVAKAASKTKVGFISKKAHVYKNKSGPLLFLKDLKEARSFIKKSFKKRAKIYYLKNAFNTILVKN